MKNPRLWIISELYYPETTSTGYILTKIAEGLADDLDVKVISGQPSYSARGMKASNREIRNGVEIMRCWATTFDKNILPLRLINLLTISVSIFVKSLLKLGKGDLVLVVTNPPSLPFAIILASKLKGAKCSLIVHDVYPDLAIAVGKLSERSLWTWLWKKLNIYLYRNMHRIFVLGRDMRAKVVQDLDVQENRVLIATNWADSNLVEPQPRDENALLHELGLSEKFVLQYAGNIGYPNDIETIIEAAVLLKDHDDIHFLFIGSGAKKPLIEAAVIEYGLTNITILEHRPRSEQTDFLNACDVALISLVGGMKGVSVPSRTYNTLAAGKPIIAIAEEGTEISFVIEEEKVGWIVPPGNPQLLVSAILAAQARRHLLGEMGIRARKAAVSKYTFENSLRVFREGLMTIVNEGLQ